ncbi:hypothetical protein A0130_14165 [Leifsonia xyli]|uniref:NYN domain-containing protein n=1 Tax=Leifsonia xyli TaxID=1575 RepID=UPI0007CE0C43|nr:hypothetical protein A0130_14165 [Leifsonia xyli]
MRSRRSVILYVDGFALYKGMLQRTYPEYKWLDLMALGSRLFPHRDVIGVKFFTAALKPLTNNPGIGQRQQIYWRALRTTGVEIVQGTFSFNKQYLPVHPEQLDASGRVVTVRVKRPEEKGSDVALASHLIVDAMEDRADSYAVVTDSDLVPPMQLLSARKRSLALVSAGSRLHGAEKSRPPISRGPRPVAEASGWLHRQSSRVRVSPSERRETHRPLASRTASAPRGTTVIAYPKRSALSRGTR